jgi:hypothetical protein
MPVLFGYRNIETGARVSFQHASAINIILSAVSSKFWLKYK